MLLTDRNKEAQPLTAVWRNGGCIASYDSFVVGSSAVLRLNFCAKNPPLRQAAKRYGAVEPKLRRQFRFENEVYNSQEIYKAEA